MNTQTLLSACLIATTGLSMLLTQMAFQVTEDQGPGFPSTTNPEFSKDSVLALELTRELDSLFNHSRDPQFLFEKARENYPFFKQVAAQTQDSVIWEGYIFCLYTYGYMAEILGRVKEGLTYLNLGIQIAKKRFGPQHYLIPFGLTKVGFSYRLTGDQITAHQYLLEAQNLFDKTLDEDDIYLVAALANTANSYDEIKEHSTALQYFQKALVLLRKYHSDRHAWTANLLIDMARSYKKAGLEQEATRYLKQAEEFISRNLSPEDPAFAFMLQSKGEFFFENEKWKYALTEFQRAKDILEKIKNINAAKLSIVYNYLGEAYSNLGDYQTSLNYHNKALQIISPATKGKNEPSNPSLDDLFEAERSRCALENKASALFNFYTNTSKKIEDLKSALSTYQLALDKTDLLLIGNEGDFSKLDICENTHSILEGAISTALQLYEDTHEDRYLDQAFLFAEKGKAFLLAENLRKANVLQKIPMPDSLRSWEKELREQIAGLLKALFDEKKENGQENEKIRKLNSQLLKIRTTYDSLQTALTEKYPQYALLLQHRKPLNLENLKDHLKKENAGLIEYFWGEKYLFSFIVTGEKLGFAKKELDPELMNRIKKFTSFSPIGEPTYYPSSADPSFFVQEAEFFFDQLLSRLLQEHHELERLIIIPDGHLFYFPFDLVLTSSQPRSPHEEDSWKELPFLFQKYIIRQEYSAEFIIDKKMKNYPPQTYLGMAPSYSEADPTRTHGEDSLFARAVFPELRDYGIHPLAFNQPEVREAASLFGSRPIIGEDASEDAFKKVASQYRILHLAVHAYTNDFDPNYSWMVFSGFQKKRDLPDNGPSAEDGFLHAYELYNLDLHAELAVLSACNTGAGRIQRGEGVMSLARAFKYAGVPNIVMSLWPANDASTQRLMTAFFRHLKDGRPKDEALRQAKLDFLNDPRNAEMTHPYFWAGFVLIGDGEPLAPQRPWWRYALLGVGSLALLGLGVGLARSRA